MFGTVKTLKLAEPRHCLVSRGHHDPQFQGFERTVQYQTSLSPFLDLRAKGLSTKLTAHAVVGNFVACQDKDVPIYATLIQVLRRHPSYLNIRCDVVDLDDIVCHVQISALSFTSTLAPAAVNVLLKRPPASSLMHVKGWGHGEGFCIYANNLNILILSPTCFWCKYFGQLIAYNHNYIYIYIYIQWLSFTHLFVLASSC